MITASRVVGIVQWHGAYAALIAVCEDGSVYEGRNELDSDHLVEPKLVWRRRDPIPLPSVTESTFPFVTILDSPSEGE